MPIRVNLSKMLLEKAKREKVPYWSYMKVYADIKISPSTLSQINTGSSNVSLSTISKLCDYFDCNPGELLERI